MHIPGLQIAMPSNAYDAKGLLKAAINCPDPVLFFEHKKLYKTKSEVPETDYTLRFGQGKIVREGGDMTAIAISNMVHVAEEAADELRTKYDFELEIIDPRTIVPLDLDLIGESLKTTNKAIIIEEGVLRGGAGLKFPPGFTNGISMNWITRSLG